MTNITYQEYWAEVESVAADILAEALEDNDNDIDAATGDIYDCRLHFTIDYHQWIIYSAYNLDVIQHSDNEDYYAENFGSEALAHSLSEGGLNMLHCHIAFWALYADVSDKLYELIQEYEDHETE